MKKLSVQAQIFLGKCRGWQLASCFFGEPLMGWFLKGNQLDTGSFFGVAQVETTRFVLLVLWGKRAGHRPSGVL